VDSLVERLHGAVVGRRRELELVVAALMADRHIVLEGPPGTGKSTLLRAVAHELGIGFEFVEGNAELTPARLVGHFDPARVLTDGYAPDVFVNGPLVTAMVEGSLLYVEEINRIPEETLNVLITVMSEQELNVPRLGRVACAPGFRLVAAMNPFDAVGTARPINCRRSRVLKYFNRFNVVRIQVVDAAADHDAVYHVQRVGTVNGRRTANTHHTACAGLARILGNLNPRCATLKRLLHAEQAHVFEVLGLDLGNGARYVAFFLGTEAHDHDFVELGNFSTERHAHTVSSGRRGL
jgi:DNA polymerase III delta prime subunit